jgi:hypothetical protein
MAGWGSSSASSTQLAWAGWITARRAPDGFVPRPGPATKAVQSAQLHPSALPDAQRLVIHATRGSRCHASSKPCNQLMPHTLSSLAVPAFPPAAGQRRPPPAPLRPQVVPPGGYQPAQPQGLHTRGQQGSGRNLWHPGPQLHRAGGAPAGLVGWRRAAGRMANRRTCLGYRQPGGRLARCVCSVRVVAWVQRGC